MGFFWEGLPPYILPWASELLGPNAIAVETGTFRGDTTALLRQHFGMCLTIERSEHLAQRARDRFAADPQVSVLLGSSRDVLAKRLPVASQPCFFWLDAHGVYDFEGPDPEENPLLFELTTIVGKRSESNTVIAIDDARGMGTQPDWPGIGEIAKILTPTGFSIVAFDDVIIATKTHMQPNFFSLYKQSRMVEAKSVFQVWHRIVKAVERRERLDALIGRFTRK